MKIQDTHIHTTSEWQRSSRNIISKWKKHEYWRQCKFNVVCFFLTITQPMSKTRQIINRTRKEIRAAYFNSKQLAPSALSLPRGK